MPVHAPVAAVQKLSRPAELLVAFANAGQGNLPFAMANPKSASFASSSNRRVSSIRLVWTCDAKGTLTAVSKTVIIINTIATSSNEKPRSSAGRQEANGYLAFRRLWVVDDDIIEP